MNPLIKGIEDYVHENVAPEHFKQEWLLAHGKKIVALTLRALVGEMEGKKRTCEEIPAVCGDTGCLVGEYNLALSDTIATLKETLLALEAKG